MFKSKPIPNFFQPALAIASLFILFFASCFSAPLVRAGEPLRVALLLEHDSPTGWSILLRQGLEQASRETGAIARVVIAGPGPEQERIFQQAARENDLVLVASAGLHEVLRNNAGSFRQRKFGCIDTGVRAANIMSVSFADEQAAYLAGFAAASVAAAAGREAVGWLAGPDLDQVPQMRSMFNAFSEGAVFARPGIRVILGQSGSFAKPGAARAEARRLLSSGAGVIVLAAGMGDQPAREEIAAAGARAIGLAPAGPDQAVKSGGLLVTTIRKRADLAVMEIVRSAASGNFAGKKIITHDLADGGVALDDLRHYLASAGKSAPAGLASRLGEIRHELENGGIRVKSLRVRTLCDCN